MDLRITPPMTIGMAQRYSSPRTPPASTPSSRILLDIPCKVCKDHSSGKHYGIFACDGCAGFFKRSIRRNRQYICKAKDEGKCLVDKTHRNQCRACRLVKCIEAGMNREAVQHERGPRNSTIRRQMSMLMKEGLEMSAPYGIPNPSMVGHHPHHQQQHHHHHHQLHHQNNHQHHHFGPHAPPPQTQASHLGYAFPRFPSLGCPRFDMSPVAPSAPPQAPPPPPPSGLTNVATVVTTTQGQPASHGLLAAAAAGVTSTPFVYPHIPKYPSPAIKVEQSSPPPPPPQQQPPLIQGLLQDVELICESAARLLFLNVQWAKNLPAFTGLPARDQQVLLEQSWRELFMLSAAQFMLPFEMAPLMANAGLTSGSVAAAAAAAAVVSVVDPDNHHVDVDNDDDEDVDHDDDDRLTRDETTKERRKIESSSSSSSKRTLAGNLSSSSLSSSEHSSSSSSSDDEEIIKNNAKISHCKTTAANNNGNNNLLTTLNEIRVLRDVLDHLKQMHVDQTEFACLKAIVLFKTAFSSGDASVELQGLKEPGTVAVLQDQAQLTLCRYIAAAYPNQPFRFGKLLLLLPTLRTVSSHTISKLFFQKTIGATPIEKVVCDMYKAQDF